MQQFEMIYKLIGTSLLAILVIIIASLSYFVAQRQFNRPILSYSAFAFTSLIFVLICVLILGWRADSLQFELTNSFVPEKIVNELLISLTFVLSFIGVQIIVNVIPRLFRNTSFNQILTQWDNDELSYERVLGEQILRSLKKSITQKDETGWVELAELTGESWGGTISQQALLLISKELWSIEQMNDNQASNKDIHEHGERLKLLLPRFAITPMNELLDKWENGHVSDDEVNNAMLLGSLKKLISDEDETGLYELKERFPDEKQKQKIQQFAETELWYLKRAENINMDLRYKKEERLHSLLLPV